MTCQINMSKYEIKKKLITKKNSKEEIIIKIMGIGFAKKKEIGG